LTLSPSSSTPSLPSFISHCKSRRREMALRSPDKEAFVLIECIY
jgi:hypothetical protein